MEEEKLQENAKKLQIKENYLIKGKIITKTGLMIGSKASLRIGGVDTPIIRDPRSGDPYIPGSSLKGKMRSLIEHSRGLYDIVEKDKNNVKGMPHASTKENKCTNPNCEICVVFGSLYNPYTHFGRLIVRDALLSQDQDVEIELKTENFIDRITGRAGDPRTFERVPAETEFDLELVYAVYGENKDKEHLKTVFEALSLLQDSYLGSSGSRGYGKIEFKINKIIRKTVEDYKNGKEGKILVSKDEGLSPEEILKEEPWNKT